MPAASGCRTGSVSHLLLLFLAICSSDHAGRMPGAPTQSKLPIEIVAGDRQPSSHVCTQPQTHASRSGFKSSTDVGAGCSCHPTGCEYHPSTRVPLHPVWPRPVARFSVQIALRSQGAMAFLEHSFSSCGTICYVGDGPHSGYHVSVRASRPWVCLVGRNARTRLPPSPLFDPAWLSLRPRSSRPASPGRREIHWGCSSKPQIR
jgi:hypothetical protein